MHRRKILWGILWGATIQLRRRLRARSHTDMHADAGRFHRGHAKREQATQSMRQAGSEKRRRFMTASFTTSCLCPSVS